MQNSIVCSGISFGDFDLGQSLNSCPFFPHNLQGHGPGCLGYLDRSLLLFSTWFLGQDQLLRMSCTLHRPAPDPLLRPIDGRYGQEGWYPRRDPTTRLAALDAERIPDRKSTSRCVMTTLHLGRDDRGKENAVSPP